ncbi:hypothetical protein RSWS8N_18009 [Cereibacter sphaeroides WS8N]|nr:hypothetical protein RSWS8N_18009 [Cereibacter sphaeroides WS8N]
MAKRKHPPLERAARALCRFRGLPEDTRFEGAPMWQSHVDEVVVVLRAALTSEDLVRLIPDCPSAATHSE